MIEVLYFFIFQSFHFHPTNFVCYHAIKWSIFDLKGRFFDENMIEFNEEHVGMLRFAIHISLDCFQISTPLFFGWVSCQSILMLLKHRKDSMNMSSNAGFSVYIWKVTTYQ